jgi:hypothetical protein
MTDVVFKKGDLIRCPHLEKIGLILAEPQVFVSQKGHRFLAATVMWNRKDGSDDMISLSSLQRAELIKE